MTNNLSNDMQLRCIDENAIGVNPLNGKEFVGKCYSYENRLGSQRFFWNHRLHGRILNEDLTEEKADGKYYLLYELVDNHWEPVYQGLSKAWPSFGELAWESPSPSLVEEGVMRNVLTGNREFGGNVYQTEDEDGDTIFLFVNYHLHQHPVVVEKNTITGEWETVVLKDEEGIKRLLLRKEEAGWPVLV